MSELSAHSLQVQLLLRRALAGDRVARDELFRTVSKRLEHLAYKMFKDFPSLRRWAEAGDVLQNASISLLKALDEVRPTSPADFYSLAAVHMRRALLDLVRQARGRKRDMIQRASDLPDGDSSSENGALRPLDKAEDPAELDRWATFHQQVERLPLEEREIVSLVFYHGWTHRDVGELLGKSERTVRRLWRSSLDQLRTGLKDH